MTQTIQRELAILRRKQVQIRTGLSRLIHSDLNIPLTPTLSPLLRGEGVILGDIKDGVFPKPVPLGPRAVGWLESADFLVTAATGSRLG